MTDRKKLTTRRGTGSAARKDVERAMREVSGDDQPKKRIPFDF